MERLIEDDELETCLTSCRYILDARSPSEFAADHIPGAINVPVLDDEQRREIGTLYKENSFDARKKGAAYAAGSIQRFLETPLIRNAGRETRFLVYCARGGQRSGSLGTVLSRIGFKVFRLKRGYKSYRQYVLSQLARPLPQPVYILYGYTGSGKTRILSTLEDQVNALDLEGCARHRGSLLGNLPGIPQPAQKRFETDLVHAISRFDPQKPTLIEGESRKVGNCAIPDPLWNQMKSARRIWLCLPRAERVRHILDDYAELKDPDYLAPILEKLTRYLGQKRTTQLRQDMDQANWPAFVDTLLEHHYDPLYRRSRDQGRRILLEADDITEARQLLARIFEDPTSVEKVWEQV